MPRRLALLVATYRYQDTGLRQLTAPGHDADALAEVLRDRKIAGFDVTILVNEPHYVVGEAIDEFYHKRCHDDLLFLYFTGHGLKDDDGRLYLAMTNTKRDRLRSTAVSARDIDDVMELCSSRQKVLALDCCYSGAFPGGRLSKSDPEVHTLERFRGRGRVVLTASDSMQYAFEGNRISGQGVRSVFTRFLVEGLRTGKADLDGDGDISVDELYNYVHDRVIEEMPQQRPKKQENVEGRIIIARNVHWSLPDYLRNAIESPIVAERLATREQLAHLHRVGNNFVRAEVINQVRRLVQDDNTVVSAAAMELMNAFTPERAPCGVEQQTAVNTQASEYSGPTDRRGLDAATARSRWNLWPFLEGLQAARPESKKRAKFPLFALPPRSGRRHRQLAFTLAVLVVTLVVVTAVITTRATPVVPVVVATIPVGNRPGNVAITSDGLHAYVTNESSNTVSVIDTASKTVTTTIPVGSTPSGVAITPDGRHVYVSNNFNSSAGTVSVIDTARGIVTATIPVGDGPVGVGATPDGRHVYVANYVSGTVSVIDTASNTVAATIHVDFGLIAVPVTPDGRHVFATNYVSGTASVIDTASNTVATSIPVANRPTGVAISPDGRHAYVANSGSNMMSVIDIASNIVTATILVGSFPVGTVVTPDGRHAYVANLNSATVSVIDTASNTVATTIPVGGSPQGIAVTPDGHYVYVTNVHSSAVSVMKISDG